MQRFRHFMALAFSAGLMGCSSAPSGGGPRRSVLPSVHALPDDFVRVEEGHLMLHQKRYTFFGTNLWYGANLAAEGRTGGDRARLLRELDRLRAAGITNVRILGGSEGPNHEPWRVVPALQPAPGVYDEAVLDGLDFLLAALKKRGLRAVICLTNFWFWSGGMAQYVAWSEPAAGVPYPHQPQNEWGDFRKFATQFYIKPDARKLFEQHATFLVSRTNKYTGIPYREEPAVMAWELANEPEGGEQVVAMRAWIHASAALLKRLDPNHLVTTGSEGATNDPVGSGVDFVLDHASPFVDYATFHLWPQNWGWFDPVDPEHTLRQAHRKAFDYVASHLEQARALRKPAVLEEFGLARDGGAFEPSASTELRDTFYALVFESLLGPGGPKNGVGGVNFWAWGGEAVLPWGAFWQPGQPFGGDPPHEPQGWYSVFASDVATQRILRAYAPRFAVSENSVGP